MLTSRDFLERLGRRGHKAGIQVASAVAARLEAYYRLLARWNQKINLTALDLEDGGDEMVDRLIIEPLVAARLVPPGAYRILDIGSGGGSPAIPMRIAVPGASLTMVEVKTRKSAFLREAIRQLDLQSTVVENARYEELLARPDLNEAADVVTVRAVRVEQRVLVRLQAFVRPGGFIFLFRGPSGPDVPSTVAPPLEWHSTHPLLDATHGRLVLLRKMPAAGADVPRGTR